MRPFVKRFFFGGMVKDPELTNIPRSKCASICQKVSESYNDKNHCGAEYEINEELHKTFLL
ncbi:MAG: hypothetical protein ACJA01_002379 [Saprospiraceae bacterium]|jgi:hypothetical protein